MVFPLRALGFFALVDRIGFLPFGLPACFMTLVGDFLAGFLGGVDFLAGLEALMAFPLLRRDRARLVVLTAVFFSPAPFKTKEETMHKGTVQTA